MKNKILKAAARVLVLVTAILLVFLWQPVSVSAAGLPYEIADAQYGVVRIIIYYTSGAINWGSGFIVGTEDDWYIVTNTHVVGGDLNVIVPPQSAAAGVDVMFETNTRLPATIVVYEPKLDVAILRVNGDIPGKKILTLNPRVEHGEEAYLIGYPLYAGNEDRSLNLFYTGTEYQTITHGYVENTPYLWPNYFPWNTVYDGRTVTTQIGHGGGNSGGPLFHADGTVMGVFFAGHGDSSTPAQGTATHVYELMCLLDANGLPYYDTLGSVSATMPGGGGGSTGRGIYSGSLSSSEILTYALVAAIAIIGLTLIIVIAARKPKPVPQPQFQQYPPWPPQ